MYGVGIQAYAALILWIPICFGFFGTMKPLQASYLALLLGIVFLPEQTVFDLPLLPPFDKQAFACMGAYFGAVMFLRDKLRRAKILRGSEVFFIIVVIGNIGTVFTNPDGVVIGGALGYDGIPTRQITLQGLTLYDIPSLTIRDALGILLPFHIGRALVRTREEAVTMWTVLVGIMLVLLLPMLLELRISPQMHRWVYGAHAADFAHSARDGGFKSTLFFASGLALAMFLFASMVGAALLRREKVRVMGLPAGAILAALWGAMLISRNAAANMYAAAVLPIVMRRNTGSAARLSVILTVLVISYPALRATQIFPAKELVELATKYSANRAQSLEFRFNNEDILLERANIRQWFGWGGFGRNRIYDERGKDISVTDGEWIIRYGMRGIVGFIGSFGLLTWPVLVAYRRRKKLGSPEATALVDTMALLVAASAIDMLPNGYFSVLPYYFAGVLAGVSEGAGESNARGAAVHLDRYTEAPPVVAGFTPTSGHGYPHGYDPRMGGR